MNRTRPGKKGQRTHGPGSPRHRPQMQVVYLEGDPRRNQQEVGEGGRKQGLS